MVDPFINLRLYEITMYCVYVYGWIIATLSGKFIVIFSVALSLHTGKIPESFKSLNQGKLWNH